MLLRELDRPQHRARARHAFGFDPRRVDCRKVRSNQHPGGHREHRQREHGDGGELATDPEVVEEAEHGASRFGCANTGLFGRAAADLKGR
ncbi:MAG TPA: hypothetical protein PLZ50_06250 [Rubrivivax sp.]|nr:hypothetical protein [Rubrivivax sp.]